MLFNSRVFIFLFLPLCLAGYALLGRVRWRAAVAWLVFCSFFYYGWWNPNYIWLMAGSVSANFILGRWMLAEPGLRRRRGILLLGAVFNFGLLAYFKYTGFLITTAGAIVGAGWVAPTIILPLAISFHTFQQHAYLVDACRGTAGRYSLLDYTLFVMFFPQLLAGPIVHHHEMLPQFASHQRGRLDSRDLSVGVSMFVIGLFKKVVIADRVALIATPVFNAAAGGTRLSFGDAWLGTLAYTLQLYFDFSAYSDMAIGVARMLGIRLPQNFNSPYKATNIIEFWRRWHMTLSRWLRDYIYIPLGGNRLGAERRYVNLMVTMLLGGLWHGAGWTFVFWGGLHGSYLIVNHLWRGVVAKRGARMATTHVRVVEVAAVHKDHGQEYLPMPPSKNEDSATSPKFSKALTPALSRSTGRGRKTLGLAAVLGAALTFLAVAIAWVFFRAKDFSSAWAILSTMFGRHGWKLASQFGDRDEVTLVALLLAAVWLVPNTQQILGRFRPCLNYRRERETSFGRRLLWRPNLWWAGGLAVLALLTILQLSQVSEFIYYQF